MLMMTLTIKVSKNARLVDEMTSYLKSEGFKPCGWVGVQEQEWEVNVINGLPTIDLAPYAARVTLLCVDKNPTWPLATC